MFERERLALDPGALEVNRAGKLSQGQRSMLRARATGALIGFVGAGVFALIVWGIGITTGPRVLLTAAVIGTVAAPVAFWAFARIREDLRSGRVVAASGILEVMFEGEDGRIWARLRGRRLRLPRAMAGIVYEPGDVTAYYTARSRMLVNVAPADLEN